MAAVITLADIVGANAKVQLAASGSARWLAFSAVGGACRLGDVNVATAQGVNLPQNATILWPPYPDFNERYLLGQIYAYVPSGTTLTVTYG